MQLRTTHKATVYGERVVGELEGIEQTRSDVPIAEFKCRYRPQGEGLVREERSNRIDRSPIVVTYPQGRDPETGKQIQLMGVLEPGQEIDVQGVTQEMEITRVNPQYGRNGIDRVTLDVESISDG